MSSITKAAAAAAAAAAAEAAAAAAAEAVKLNIQVINLSAYLLFSFFVPTSLMSMFVRDF